VRRPANWRDSKKNDVISLQSRDRCLAMTLAAPVAAGQAQSLRHDGISVLRESYKNVKVQGTPASRIGGIPTTTNTVAFKDPKGNQIRVLLSVGRGEKNAYLTEVVVRDPACQGDLALAQVVLSSIQYTK
jgi:hypothetical protein